MKIVSISLGCTAGLVLIFLLVRIIKKKRLSAAEKEALEAAEQERKIPLSQREPDPEPEEPEETGLCQHSGRYVPFSDDPSVWT